MLSRATGAPRSLYLLCAIALLLVAAPAFAAAQPVGQESGAVRTAITGGADTEVGQVMLLVGRSTVVNIGQSIARVSLTRPEIADAIVTGSQQLLVHGKAPGTISMFVWDRSGGIKRYDVVVTRDLSQLNEQLHTLFPGESISVTGNGKDVVVSGTVSSKYIIEKAVEVAAGYVEKKEDVVNMLRQQEGIATDQVLLRVRFAEVSRSALTDLGVSLFSDGNRNTIGSSTTQQFSAPFFDQRQPLQGKNLIFSDYLNLYLFNTKNQIGLTIRALQNKGLLQSLAEPNLIAQNGKEASFLAGGEYPYPVVQGSTSNLAVTIVFKEYGIRLNFTPTLLGGDLIHLKVRPEVSSLDFANAISYQGFRIPALSTRRADTEVELQDGQTFAIAGLLNNTVTNSMSKIPGIGDIPILGYLFRSKSADKQQTELVVTITPQIIRKGGMGAATGLPNITEPYLPAAPKVIAQPPVRLPGGGGKGDTTPDPEPVATPAAPQATAAQQQVAPGNRSAGARNIQPPPAQVNQAPAGQPETKIDAKRLAEDRKALEQAAEQQRQADEQDRKAGQQKKQDDKRAADRAAKEQKAKEEAEARERDKQQAQEAKRREAEAKAAGERKRAEAKAAEEQRKAEVKRAEEQVKAERARLEEAQKQAEELKKEEDKLAKERAKRDAEAAKLSSELQKKQTEAEKKRLKEIQEAVDRLTAAQAAYQAAVQKAASKKDGGQ